MTNKQINIPASVVVIPSVMHGIADKKVSFLFSAQQVEEIVDSSNVWSIPFSPEYVEGITGWRNEVLPVISLEKRLGFNSVITEYGGHLLVVRAVNRENDEAKWIRGLIRVGSGIRNVTLPIEASPITTNGWLPRHDPVRGVYEWQDGYLVVTDLDMILIGQLRRSGNDLI